MFVTVDCYSGYQGEEKPKRFWDEQREIRVLSVLKTWRTPDAQYFQVLGDDQKAYTLKLNRVFWRWDLIANDPTPCINNAY